MPKIEVYLSQTCPFCVRAKSLLDAKGAAFKEIDVRQNPEWFEEMVQRANGRRTVPQIFVDDHHVGGFDDLHALDQQGGLDPLLND